MATGKCRVEVIINCYDEEGDLISDIPKGSWFKIDREEMNMVARSITTAIVKETEIWEKNREENRNPPKPPRTR